VRSHHPSLPWLALTAFRHNNKAVDLSRTIRLSGLSSGAKLELVQLSKSTGVVNVALQLPPSEAQSPAQARLTDKFPSTTTLWLLLRKFEAGVAGSSAKRNLTARGVPSAGAGAGRLYYEQPVLDIMGRQLSTFTDLQKTLSQLGFNSGSALVKLTFKATETPLEEAMNQIQHYFDEADPPPPSSEPVPSSSVAEEPAKEPVKPEWLEDEKMQDVQSTPQTGTTQSTNTEAPAQPTDTEATLPNTQPSSSEPTTTISDRPVSVYRPPTSSGPPDIKHNDSDYTPTVEHAQIHQKLLQQESRNKRLPTDAELAAKQKEQKEELSKIESIEIKIRFPDQSAVSSKFGQTDTSSALYRFVRECLDQQFKSEPFVLRNPGVRDKDGGLIVEGNKRLILDLQLRGRVLVVFGWDDKASVSARSNKEVLRADLRQQAREYVAPEMQGVAAGEQDEKGVKVDLGSKTESSEGGGSKGKMPKWLKGLGKK